MAKKTVADAAKAKAAKQKKIAIGLICILALAAAYAAKTMMSLNSGGGTKPQAVAAVPTTTPAATTTPSSLAAPTLTGSPGTTSYPSASGTTTTPAVTGSTQLVAAVQSSADTGQLQSFSRFATKDPFDSLGPQAAGSTSGVPEGTSSGSGKSGGTTTTPATPPTPPTPPPTAAVISVNGVMESVTTGSDFPASATPLFQLVSLTAKAAQVSIAGGSYASGQATLTLQVNKPVTLVNTADGTRYTLLLMPQGTVAPSPSSSSSSSSTPTPAAPTTTTTTSTTPSSTP
jgi:hypothetical protein